MEKVKCMNCGSLQFEKDIKYLGGTVWECPDCSDERRCHLCGAIEIDKYCTNKSCYEYTRHETGNDLCKSRENEFNKLREDDLKEIKKAYKILDRFIKAKFKDNDEPIYDLIVKIRKVFKK